MYINCKLYKSIVGKILLTFYIKRVRTVKNFHGCVQVFFLRGGGVLTLDTSIPVSAPGTSLFEFLSGLIME